MTIVLELIFLKQTRHKVEFENIYFSIKKLSLIFVCTPKKIIIKIKEILKGVYDV